MSDVPTIQLLDNPCLNGPGRLVHWAVSKLGFWDWCVKNTHEHKNLVILARPCPVPCTGFYWTTYVDKEVLVLPPSASLLEQEEASSLLARLQGAWGLAKVSGQPAGCCSFMNDERMAGAVYTVTIEGSEATVLTKMKLLIDLEDTKTTSLQFYRTQEGKLYVMENEVTNLYCCKDSTYRAHECTRFAPEEGVVAFRDAYSECWEWRKGHSEPVTSQPAAGDPLLEEKSPGGTQK